MSEQLHEAVRAGEVARARELIAAGEDANDRDGYGATALMNAAHQGNAEMVRALIAAGADVNAVDDAGWNAIHKAVYNSELDRGFAEVVDILAKAGCDVDARIGYGIRPLMLAAGYGEAAVCEALLANGADILARNDGGLTALMMVKDKFYVEVINMLHAAEQDAGVGEGSCASKNAPGSNVVTFLKPLAKTSDH